MIHSESTTANPNFPQISPQNDLNLQLTLGPKGRFHSKAVWSTLNAPHIVSYCNHPSDLAMLTSRPVPPANLKMWVLQVNPGVVDIECEWKQEEVT